jgi:ubiquinone/menaquinone biosynthesis C-methylase UbiE
VIEDRELSEQDRIAEVYRRRGPTDVYSLFSLAHLWALQEVEREALAVMRRAGCSDLTGFRVLDVGCGGGFWLRRMIDWGIEPANLHGIDTIASRVELARTRLPASVSLVEGDAGHLPWPDAHFDLVTQFVVFSSILAPENRQSVASEIARVLKPGGMIVWYDLRMDNPRNSDVAGTSVREVRSLFAGFNLDVRRVTLAPPLARRVAPVSPFVFRLLAAAPWLRTHLLIGLNRPT